jgi:hypothetical protein
MFVTNGRTGVADLLPKAGQKIAALEQSSHFVAFSANPFACCSIGYDTLLSYVKLCVMPQVCLK